MSERAGKKPTGGLAMLLLGMAILAPMVLLVECGHAEGRITATGGPHGDFAIDASDCHTLLPFGSHGAAVRAAGENAGAAYVIVDPATQGREVRLEVPGSCGEDAANCTTVLVSEEACRTFEVAVENTGVTVNRVRLVKGHAALECTLADGTEISGRLDFDGC